MGSAISTGSSLYLSNVSGEEIRQHLRIGSLSIVISEVNLVGLNY
jgi:hypothetical protein